MADPTPEERAANSFNRVFEGRGPMYVARLADLIREAEEALHAVYRVKLDEAHRCRVIAETAARAKAFEDGAEDLSARASREDFGSATGAVLELTDRFRARAKEAPRGS